MLSSSADDRNSGPAVLCLRLFPTHAVWAGLAGRETLSILVVLRKAHPQNRKLDLESKTLCSSADSSVSTNLSEQEAKNQQNVRTFNYNALDETSARPGIKTSPTHNARTCNPTSANWGRGGTQTKKQTN